MKNLLKKIIEKKIPFSSFADTKLKSVERVTDNVLHVEIDGEPSTDLTASTWSHSSRMQSMVVQNDGSIILCNSENEIGETSSSASSLNLKITPSPYNIEVLEILSPNYLHTPSEIKRPNLLPLQTHPAIKRQSQASKSHNRNQSQSTSNLQQPKAYAKKRPSHMLPKRGEHAQRFVCPRCGKDYSQRKNMRRHYRLECGQEPRYPCPICNLRFKRNNQMNSHLLTRHGIKDTSKDVYFPNICMEI